MVRLLGSVRIPAQPAADCKSSSAAAAAPQVTEHDHAWRRVPGERGTQFAEYRCDLCELSYSE